MKILPNREYQRLRERDAWEETARQFSRDTDYYRDLVVRIGKIIGDDAFICDDGSRSEDVLCSKVPGLVEKLLGEFDWVALQSLRKIGR